ncbi:PaaI family thioesterase [Ramlibacter sp.]|uniref:PaaI family thioesterase n=1 Tax=Ramlibacter sp. TaxID=1917967 RepID=UPI003FA7CD83
MGTRVDYCRDGSARSTVTPTESACWPWVERPHGGVLFAIADSTMAWAAMSLTKVGESVATVDCSIHYPAPAALGPFTCHATSARKVVRTIFIRAEIVGSRGTIVAL